MEGRLMGDTATQTDSEDRSIRNAPHGQQMVLTGVSLNTIVMFLLFLVGVTLIVAILAWGDSRSAAKSADIAERRANISELYAKQVFVELNRLGYPVKTPAEEHSVAPVEAHQ
jgi:hypothetical protein